MTKIEAARQRILALIDSERMKFEPGEDRAFLDELGSDIAARIDCLKWVAEDA